MGLEWWFQKVQEGGAVAAVLLLGAVLWLNADRKRLLESLKQRDAIIAEKDAKLESLAERALVLFTKVETFLFQGRQS